MIGFNRDVAWTFTNIGADVMDFYIETVDDPVGPTQYQLDGAWTPLDRRVERYCAPDGTLLGDDTMRYTHRGPMRRINDRWISHRWTVLESTGREMEVFDQAARPEDGAGASRFHGHALSRAGAEHARCRSRRNDWHPIDGTLSDPSGQRTR